MTFEERKTAFVSASSYLKLAKDYWVKELKVYVHVVDNANPTKVISELIELVKISEPNEAFFSQVTVFSDNTIVQFYVSFNKKVLFLNRHGERITKAKAIEIVRAFNI